MQRPAIAQTASWQVFAILIPQSERKSLSGWQEKVMVVLPLAA
jgi:hypothetical protein